MTFWVLVPAAVLLLGCATCFVAGFLMNRRRRGAGLIAALVAGLACAVGFAVAVVAVCALVPGAWLHADPTPGWGEKTWQADAAVVFGYGLGPSRHPMTAGNSNAQLLEWTLAHTSAPKPLVQEGVWIVHCSERDESCVVASRTLVRMHRHVEGVRVDTLEAARCAAERLLAMKATRVVVVAHDLQLRRAAWDLARALRALGGSGIETVVPDVGVIVSPGSCTQWQTWKRPIFTAVELLWARPRDFLRCFPEECPAP